MGWVGAAAQAVVDFLVQPACHACGVRLDAPSARGAMHPAVSRLREPVTVRLAGLSLESRLLCDACVASIRPWREPHTLVLSGGAPLSVFPAFFTDNSILALIHLLKFERARPVAPWLASAMADGLPARAARVDAVIVPVPMDNASRRRRGFNQAERIAAELSRRWNLPLVCEALRKPAPTVAQSRLDRAARLRNLAGSFRGGPGMASVRGRPVVLVDDLVTTGSTAHACATVLAAAGAARVEVVAAGCRP